MKMLFTSAHGLPLADNWVSVRGFLSKKILLAVKRLPPMAKGSVIAIANPSGLVFCGDHVIGLAVVFTEEGK